MTYVTGAIQQLLFQQSGQVQLLIIAPILTLSLLSLVVRTASSAVDASLEKKKVTAQIKRRLNEVQKEDEVLPSQASVKPDTSQTPPRLSDPLVIAPEAMMTKAEPAIDTPITYSKLSLASVSSSTHQITLRIKKRATLESILRDEQVSQEERGLWVTAAHKVKTLKNLRPNHTLTLSFTVQEEERSLQSVSYEVDKRLVVLLEKKQNGKISSRKETVPLTLVWRVMGGRIESNLYNAARKAGLSARQIDDLADLDWDIDFTSDPRPGDTFKVIVEEFQRDGKRVEYGQILAVEIVNKGKVFTQFSLPRVKKSATAKKYDRQFLRYPVQFTRISSVFTDARFHPVLERVRPHRGVDFAAPRGTPVQTIANGKVTFAGRQAGYGNIVSIDHPGPYDSSYAHLQSIVKGVKEGVSVESGQIIGFVGSTGLATGPHLHFELHKHGEYVNPLTEKFLALEDVSPQRQEHPAFAELKRRLAEHLSGLKLEKQTVTLAVAAPQNLLAALQESSKIDKDERIALATSRRTSDATSGLGTAVGGPDTYRSVEKKTPRSRSRRDRNISAQCFSVERQAQTGKLQKKQGISSSSARCRSALQKDETRGSRMRKRHTTDSSRRSSRIHTVRR